MSLALFTSPILTLPPFQPRRALSDLAGAVFGPSGLLNPMAVELAGTLLVLLVARLGFLVAGRQR